MRNYNKCKSVGELVLKNGVRDKVTWEANLEEGAVVSGVLRGNKRHLKTAAKDRCAILSFGKGRTAAIAIDGHRDGKLFFTSLLTSTPIFLAQNILFSAPRSNGTEYGIEFSNGKGETLQVIVPSADLWDLLPHAFDDLKEFLVPQVVLSDYQPVQTVFTGIDRDYSLVYVGFNGGQPYAIGSEQARQTAGELYELAAKIEGGPYYLN